MRIREFTNFQAVQIQINKTTVPALAPASTESTGITRVKQPVSAPITPSYNCAPPAGLDKLFGRVAPPQVTPAAMVDQLSKQADKLVQDMVSILQSAGQSGQSGPSFEEWFSGLMGQATEPSARCGNVFTDGIPAAPQDPQQACETLQEHMNTQGLAMWEQVCNVMESVLDLLHTMTGQSHNTQSGMQNEIKHKMHAPIGCGTMAPYAAPVACATPSHVAPAAPAAPSAPTGCGSMLPYNNWLR